MAHVGIIEETRTSFTDKVQTVIPKAQTVPVPGLSYIPDRIEVTEDRWLMTKLGHEMLDFIKILNSLLDLMHLIKTKHLRSMTPIPSPVIRELTKTGKRGPLFKAFDRNVLETNPTASPSVETVFRAAGFAPAPTRRTKKSHKRDHAGSDKNRFPFANDLVEITGKKTRTAWQSVVLEKPEALNVMTEILARRRQASRSPEEEKLGKFLQRNCRKNEDLMRTKTETTDFSIKFVLTNLGDALGNPDEKLQGQIEIMEAANAGFRTVEEHKAFLSTLSANWFKVLTQSAMKLGVITCKDMITALNKLAGYYNMNHNSLPFAKAKLCLVVMSLPFWDVALVQTQRAVEFILEKVLLLPEKPLRDWLKVRNIHYVVFPAYSAEDFQTMDFSDPGEEVGDQDLIEHSESNITDFASDSYIG